MTDSCAIHRVRAREVLDSRGSPTVEAEVHLRGLAWGRASVPAGASTGRHEAHELRDGDPRRYAGRGVLKAVHHVHTEIAAALEGVAATDQPLVDRTMVTLDGTESLRRLGANAILAVSMACCRAAAQCRGLALHQHLAELSGTGSVSLPVPQGVMFSGRGGAAAGLSFQDFMVLPIGARSYPEALAMLERVESSALEVLRQSNTAYRVASDGALGLAARSNRHALELTVRAIEGAGLRPGEDVGIGLDVAATEFCDKAGGYRVDPEGSPVRAHDLAEYLRGLLDRFPIVSIEDPFDEEDWPAWSAFTASVPELQVVADDLYATHPERARRGVTQRAATAGLMKLNQNGTLSGTLEVIRRLREAGHRCIVAGRSADTEDAFIADLAVGTGAGQIKIGARRGGERLAKYNQLLRLSEDVGWPGPLGLTTPARSHPTAL
ncbi:MAG: phosphopyruvate hydratase [Myxococcales bacterium FL481]|nr:MAG: phosphopyruvate hydratase [Myxococcales bacterium FL481]